jgi:hypothetical protein
MSARGTSVNAEFMLDANDVYIADVEKIRSSKIRRQVLFFNLEADDIGIFVAPRNIIHRNRKALTLRVRARHSGKQVGRKSCDAALSWQVVTNKSNFVNFRSFLQVNPFNVPYVREQASGHVAGTAYQGEGQQGVIWLRQMTAFGQGSITGFAAVS